MRFECALEEVRTAVADRYQLEGEIGRGGSAIVFLGHDLRHGRPVALKLLNPAVADWVGTQRFSQEIEITAGLQHPHILPLLDSGTAAGSLFLVTPFVTGGSLRELMDQRGPLPLADVLRLGHAVAGALSYAHRQGVVHLDIKPENILLSDGHPVVADFGIARAICDRCPLTTEDGELVFGTPAYMSPEQALGGPLDARSDIYSFAAVLYEMLTAKSPAVRPGPHAMAALRLPMPPVAVLRPGIPVGLARVIDRGLSPDPEARPHNMDALAAELWDPVPYPLREPSRRLGHRQLDLFPLAL